MLGAFRNLDRVLRGDATRVEKLRHGRLDVPARGLAMAALLLGMFYGICMGSYGVVTGKEYGWLQIVSSMLKVPALFLLTLIVTFPSLYVFNALVGSRLSMVSMLRLLVAGIATMLALLASFGTIVAFFGFTSTSYTFMKLLNVVVFAISGILGLSFLLQTLHRLTVSMESEAEGYPTSYSPPPPPPPPPTPTEQAATPGVPPQEVEVTPVAADASQAARRPGALERGTPREVGSNVKMVFRIWVFVFGLVGAQMAWVLRPFIGGYESGEFVWFRERSGNFFENVWESILRLLHG